MLEYLQELSDICAYEYPYLLPILFGLMGLSIGSYLNVVIYRVPRGLSTNNPSRSFCPNCKKLIPWYLNIPVLSWVILRGLSACCKQPISPRYLLVELLTAALFVWASLTFSYENLLAQICLCLWIAIGIAIAFIDWEQMIVSVRLCCLGGVSGFLVAFFSPSLVSDGATLEPTYGALYSLFGAGLSFLIIKSIAVLGRAAFGRKSEQFDEGCVWSMCATEDEEDIVLSINGKKYLWSELFFDAGHKLIFKNASLKLGEHIQGKVQDGNLTPDGECDIQMTATHIILPDGGSIPLLDYQSAAGTCSEWVQMREAMGSGDAWIALAIGALVGWQGFAVALIAGSIIGILWAILTRVSRGVPMPFGPCLILGTFVYLQGWHQVLWNYYLSLY